MESPVAGSWNAKQCANIGFSRVLRPLRVEENDDEVFLSGLGALALCAAALKVHLPPGARGSAQSIVTTIEHVQVKTKWAPIVINISPRFSEENAIKDQLEFAESLDARHGKALHEPFQSSMFYRQEPTRPGAGLGTHVTVGCHLKYLRNPVPSAFLVARRDTTGTVFRYTPWPVLVVQQLVLGADATDDEGIYAALMIARWALAVGREEVDAAHARAPAPAVHSHPIGAPASVTSALTDAVNAMLMDETVDAVIDVWLARFGDNVPARAASFEWTHNDLARTAFGEAAGLTRQYEQFCSVLTRLLKEAVRALFLSTLRSLEYCE